MSTIGAQEKSYWWQIRKKSRSMFEANSCYQCLLYKMPPNTACIRTPQKRRGWDAFVGYRDAWNILEKYPRATFVVFDRAGHQVEEKENLINALTNEWLDRVAESVRLV